MEDRPPAQWKRQAREHPVLARSQVNMCSQGTRVNGGPPRPSPPLSWGQVGRSCGARYRRHCDRVQGQESPKSSKGHSRVRSAQRDWLRVCGGAHPATALAEPAKEERTRAATAPLPPLLLPPHTLLCCSQGAGLSPGPRSLIVGLSDQSLPIWGK